jgi:hypothetical protein
VLINPIIRTRIRHFRRAYLPTRDNIIKIDLREIGWGGMDWMIWLRIGTSGGSCEHGNEPACSIKFWKILSNSKLWFLKEASVRGSWLVSYQYVEHIALNDRMTDE